MCQHRAKATHRPAKKKKAAKGKKTKAAKRTHHPVKATSRTCTAAKAGHGR